MKVGEKMAAWTLEEAKLHLKTWLDAEMAVATGQSYQINGRRLDRANLYQIREQIKFWRDEIKGLEGKRRTFGVIPRDF